jgi:hypothetical protein
MIIGILFSSFESVTMNKINTSSFCRYDKSVNINSCQTLQRFIWNINIQISLRCVIVYIILGVCPSGPPPWVVCWGGLYSVCVIWGRDHGRMDRGRSRLSERVHVIHVIFNGWVDPTSL